MDGTEAKAGREELPDSSIATGIFAVLGTVVGAVLQAGGTRTQNQRRANGKVLAGVQQAHLECEAINSEFSKEDDLIKRAKEAQQPLPPMTYHEDLSFKDREARTWNLINKAQDAVTDNVLQLTVGFSQAYWKFYRELTPYWATDMPLNYRYKDAEEVFKHWERTLRKKAEARGALWFLLAPVAASLAAGIAAGAWLATHWVGISAQFPDWLISSLDKLGLG